MKEEGEVKCVTQIIECATHSVIILERMTLLGLDVQRDVCRGEGVKGEARRNEGGRERGREIKGEGREKGKVRHALSDHLGKNDFPEVICLRRDVYGERCRGSARVETCLNKFKTTYYIFITYIHIE